MSHKTNPISNRLPLTKQWRSRWYADNLIAYYILEDAAVRDLLSKRFGNNAGVERVEIQRNSQELMIMIHTSKPGIVIGRGGAGIKELRVQLERKLQSFRYRNFPLYVKSAADQKTIESMKLKIEIVEIKAPELHSSLVAQSIANQIERRIAYRRAIKQAIERTVQRNAKGIRVSISGRLNGADIARTEKFSEGTVPLSTLRNDIDYAHVDAHTTYGVIGIKVWIYRGDKLADALKPQGRRIVE
ncbi:30S ribosomal protein S3 [Candidatus Berkelbacteria bacterium]|nr:30S ribosomal protein S3 [Candidatus Berkelbacteria bacterium]